MVIAGPDVLAGFDGIIDQVEYSHVARSESWLKLCYENQRPDQRLVVPEPSDIVLQAGTSAVGLDGAKVHLHAGGRHPESGTLSLMPGHKTEHSQRVPSAVEVGSPAEPRTLKVSTVTGFDGEQQGAAVSLRGGDGLNAGGQIVLNGGNAQFSPGLGGGDIVLMPGGTSPSSAALPGAVIVGSAEHNRSLRVHGSIDVAGSLFSNGVAFTGSQWHATPSGGIGYAGPVAVGGLDPGNYMLRVEGPALVNGEILTAGSGSRYLVYTQKADKNNGLYWDDAEGDLELWTNTGRRMVVKSDGRVGIGTDDPGLYRLAVEGAIGCRELVVSLDQWADNVFDSAYALPTLQQVQDYIRANKRLPGMPSETEVKEKGVNVGEMQAALVRKIEELTLYVIDLVGRNRTLEARLKELGDVLTH